MADISQDVSARSECSDQEISPSPYKPEPLLIDPVFGKSSSANYTCHFYSIAANTTNEDRILSHPELGLCGIFDGHGGYTCSDFAKNEFPKVFQELHKKKSTNIDELEAQILGTRPVATNSAPALSKSLEKVDEMFLTRFADKMKTCGSCACVCHVECGVATVANLGDSRAVLGRLVNRRLKKFLPIVLSDDQNTQNKKECDAVYDRSGDPRAIRCNDSVAHHRDAPKRVAGSLMVTRALGDAYLKEKKWSTRAFWDHLPYITSEPIDKTVTLTTADKFIVVGSDGLWEHLKNEEVVDIVGRALMQMESGGGEEEGVLGPEYNLAEGLVDECIKQVAKDCGVSHDQILSLERGSGRRGMLDDVSVVVMVLDGHLSAADAPPELLESRADSLASNTSLDSPSQKKHKKSPGGAAPSPSPPASKRTRPT